MSFYPYPKVNTKIEHLEIGLYSYTTWTHLDPSGGVFNDNSLDSADLSIRISKTMITVRQCLNLLHQGCFSIH